MNAIYGLLVGLFLLSWKNGENNFSIFITLPWIPRFGVKWDKKGKRVRFGKVS